jgi:hypothetical protein
MTLSFMIWCSDVTSLLNSSVRSTVVKPMKLKAAANGETEYVNRVCAGVFERSAVNGYRDS